MQKIGIFGGTFNPPHSGHLRLAEAFAKEMDFDKILVIPTFVPPHKKSSQLASCEDRLNMCRLAFTNPIFEINDIEINRGGKSYTYDTLLQLKEQYKDAEFSLIIGSDMFLSFHEWHRAEDIFKMCNICATVREDSEKLSDLHKYAKSHFPKQAEKLKLVLIDFDPIEVSSTQLRQMLNDGLDISELVPKEVVKYIEDRGLYNAGKD